jgi:hypothetical protein
MAGIESYKLVSRIDVFKCTRLCMYQVYERIMIVTLRIESNGNVFL